MIILKLTLKKEWFDMILSGKKTEEYREIKPYWQIRLNELLSTPYPKFRIEFTNGYGKKRPMFCRQGHDIFIGKGKKEWGAPDKEVYIIQTGNIVYSRGCF